MKKYGYFSVVLLFILFSSVELLAQYDDVYFDGEEDVYGTENNDTYTTSNTNTYEAPDDEFTEEYVDANHDYAYSARIRRFHRPARGFNYYSNYYVDNYWYDPYSPGVNIYTQSYYNNYGGYYQPRYGCGWTYSNGHGWRSWTRWGWRHGYGWNNNRNWNAYSWNNNWNNNNNWNIESSAPNAANFVTTRHGRSADAGIHRSRRTAVSGYDTDQRRPHTNNNVQNTELNEAMYKTSNNNPRSSATTRVNNNRMRATHQSRATPNSSQKAKPRRIQRNANRIFNRSSSNTPKRSFQRNSRSPSRSSNSSRKSSNASTRTKTSRRR